MIHTAQPWYQRLRNMSIEEVGAKAVLGLARQVAQPNTKDKLLKHMRKHQEVRELSSKQRRFRLAKLVSNPNA